MAFIDKLGRTLVSDTDEGLGIGKPIGIGDIVSPVNLPQHHVVGFTDDGSILATRINECFSPNVVSRYDPADFGLAWGRSEQDRVRFDLLRKLYFFIGSLPDEKVVMKREYTHRPGGHITVTSVGEAESCGAVACGMGWAGLMSSFQKEGLCYVPGEGLVLTTPDNAQDPHYDRDRFRDDEEAGNARNVHYYFAAHRVMNLTHNEALALFYVVGGSCLDDDTLPRETDDDDKVGRICLLQRIERFFDGYGEKL